MIASLCLTSLLITLGLLARPFQCIDGRLRQHEDQLNIGVVDPVDLLDVVFIRGRESVCDLFGIEEINSIDND